MATVYYIGDKWPLNFGVKTLPDNWASLEFRVDIGRDRQLGKTADVTATLTKENVPAEYTDTYAGWLAGAVERDVTKDLTPGRYYMQVSLWDSGQPQSSVITVEVGTGFSRTAP